MFFVVFFLWFVFVFIWVGSVFGLVWFGLVSWAHRMGAIWFPLLARRRRCDCRCGCACPVLIVACLWRRVEDLLGLFRASH